jgi:hypothetical protein
MINKDYLFIYYYSKVPEPDPDPEGQLLMDPPDPDPLHLLGTKCDHICTLCKYGSHFKIEMGLVLIAAKGKMKVSKSECVLIKINVLVKLT